MSQSRKNFLQTLGVGIGSAVVGLPNVSRAEESNHANQPVIKPKRLKKGDTIGLISPGFSLNSDDKYGKIEQKIKDQGFKIKVGKHATDHWGYFAGTDKNRAADVNTMFADSEVDGIMCFRGGWGCDRLLDYLNFRLIRQNPKPLIGFSDITTLLLSIYAKTGLVTFHGPLGVSDWTPFNTSYFDKALIEARPFVMKPKGASGDYNGSKTIRKGRAAGRLLGGNLTVLTSMLGSDYLPDWEQSLLFVEEVGEELYRVDRMLTQLHLNGVFEKINGFIFGKCVDCPVGSGRHFTLKQILNQHIRDYDIPAFWGTNISHAQNIFTLPVGVKAQMDADKRTILIPESPVA